MCIDSDIDHPFCIDAHLSLVSNDLGAAEVNDIIVVINKERTGERSSACSSMSYK